MLCVHPNLGYDMTATAGGHNIDAEVMRHLNWTDVAARRRDCPHKTRTRQLAVMPSFSFLKESHRLGIVARDAAAIAVAPYRDHVAFSRCLTSAPKSSLDGVRKNSVVNRQFAKSVDMRGNTDESWRRGLEYLLHNYL